MEDNKSKTFYGSHETSLLSSFDEDRENEDNFCDVTIIVDGKEFIGHKNILSKLSPVFRRMFKTEMKEKYDGFANIRGVDHNTMELIFEFIYKTKIEINSKNIHDLLAASDYLQLDGLKKCCLQYLMDEMDTTNCLQVLSKSQLYNQETIESATLNLKSIIKNIQSQNEFLKLTRTELVEIFQHLKETVDMREVYEAVIAWIRFANDEREKHCVDLVQKLVDINALSTEYLQEVVAKEPLLDCPTYNRVILNTLFSRLSQKQVAGSNKKIQTLCQGKIIIVCGNSPNILHINDNFRLEALPDFTPNLISLGVFDNKIFGFCYDLEIIMLDLKKREEGWKVLPLTTSQRIIKIILFQERFFLTGNDTIVEIFDPKHLVIANAPSLTNSTNNRTLVEHMGDLLCVSIEQQRYYEEKCYKYELAWKAEMYENAWKEVKSLEKKISVTAATTISNVVGVSFKNQLILLQCLNNRRLWINRAYYPLMEREFPPLNHCYDKFDGIAAEDCIFLCGRSTNGKSIWVEKFQDNAWAVVFQKQMENKITHIFAS